MADDDMQKSIDIVFSKAKTFGLITNPSEEYKKKCLSSLLELNNNDRFNEECPKFTDDFMAILDQSGAMQACKFAHDQFIKYGIDIPPLREEDCVCCERDFEEKLISLKNSLRDYLEKQKILPD